MSEGSKRIEIKIAATGGDQAAAEVKKVDAAIAGETVTLNKLEAELREATAAYKSAEVGTEQFVAASKRVEAAHINLTAATGKVTKSGVQMGTGMQNVGYQVQDVAVQIGSGTSVFRALGQQLPQLLSGFGPLGITLGTVSAVALPLAGAMFGLGNATEEAGEKADEAEEKWKKLGDARLAKQVAAGAKDFKAYLDGLDDEWEKLNRNNEGVQRSINLIQAEQRAKVGIQNAQAALDLAEIDASDKPEADKIQARAKVQRRVERQRFDNEREQAGFRVNASFNTAAGATQKANEKAGDVDSVRETLAKQEAEAANLRGRIDAAERANASLPKLEKEIAGLRVPLAPVMTPAGPVPVSKEAEENRKSLLEKAEAERIKLTNAANGASDNDRRRLDQLAGEKDDKGVRKGGEIATSKDTVESLSKAAKDLEAIAAKLREEYENNRVAEYKELEGKFVESKLRLQATTTTSSASAAAAEKRDKDKADRDAAQAARRQQQDNLGDREKTLDDTSRARGLTMRDAGNKTGNKTAQDVGKALSDGTNAAEIQKLGDQVKEAAGKNGAAMTAALEKVLAELNSQSSEIEKLKGQIRKGRDMK